MYCIRPITPAYWAYHLRLQFGLCQISFHVAKTWLRGSVFTERYKKKASWTTRQMFIIYDTAVTLLAQNIFGNLSNPNASDTILEAPNLSLFLSLCFFIHFASTAPFAAADFYWLPSVSWIRNALNVNLMGSDSHHTICGADFSCGPLTGHCSVVTSLTEDFR